jgi:hypothetical protein
MTLVEMIVAAALFGFVLLGITPLFMASVKSNSSGNEYTGIHMLARDRLEQLMNLPFGHPQLAAGTHCNDLSAMLPDPKTGLLPTPGPNAVRNPFTVTYEVKQFQIPCAGCPGAPAAGAAFTPTEITGAGSVFQYKRIDVTVKSGSGLLGIGIRRARVSGIVSNPFPEEIPSTGPVSCP